MLSFCISVSFAQTNLRLKKLPPIKLNSGVLAPDSSYLSFEDQTQDWDLSDFLDKNIKVKKVVVVPRPRYNMPVVKPQEYNWNMPIIAPDSTINYAIRIIGAGKKDPKDSE